MLQEEESRGGRAERPADVDAIAAPRAAAQERLLRLADRGDGDEELRRAREIAADDLDAPLAPQLFNQRPRFRLVGRSDGHHRIERFRPHRRQVGEVDGDALAGDQWQRRRGGEVDVFDHHVVGDDLLADDRRVVAGAREERADARQKVGLAHDTGTIGASGRSKPSP